MPPAIAAPRGIFSLITRAEAPIKFSAIATICRADAAEHFAASGNLAMAEGKKAAAEQATERPRQKKAAGAKFPPAPLAGRQSSLK